MGQLNKSPELLEKAEKIFLERNNLLNAHLDKSLQQLAKELTLHQIELEIQNQDLVDSQLALKESYNKYKILYDLTPVSYFTLNEDGLIIEANQAGASLLGIQADILINKLFSRYIFPENHFTFSNHTKIALETMSIQKCAVKLMGKIKVAYVNIESISMMNTITQKKELLMCLTDIGESKPSTDFFQQQSNKQVNLNNKEFALAIMHEVNHPLAVIANYLNGCITRIENNTYKIDEILFVIKKCASQSLRASQIMLRMKDFTIKGNLNCELICLDALIKEAIGLFPFEWGDVPVDVQYRASSNLPKMLLDKFQIQQVIINLARNAIEAMRDANTLQPKLIIDMNSGGKNTVEVAIIDNGPGIDVYAKQKIFTPYFTTKPYGIGLGLIMCRVIIEAHGGVLEMSSHPTGGACFLFTLPIKA